MFSHLNKTGSTFISDFGSTAYGPIPLEIDRTRPGYTDLCVTLTQRLQGTMNDEKRWEPDVEGDEPSDHALRPNDDREYVWKPSDTKMIDRWTVMASLVHPDSKEPSKGDYVIHHKSNGQSVGLWECLGKTFWNGQVHLFVAWFDFQKFSDEDWNRHLLRSEDDQEFRYIIPDTDIRWAEPATELEL